MLETPEGYLICKNVPIGRAGTLQYTGQELELNDYDTVYTVIRTPEENRKPEVLASFEGKPITDGHPDIDVDKTNYNYYSKGHLQNVRAGNNTEGFIFADLFITDENLIEDIKNGTKREVSCGYDTSYIKDDSGRLYQTNIRGNHLAVVENGRAGHLIRINDELNKKILRGENSMSKDIKSILNDFDKKIANVKTLDEFNELIKETSRELEDKPTADAPIEVQAPASAPTEKNDDTQALLQAINSLSAKVEKLIAGQPQNDRTPEQDIDKAIAELSVEGEKNQKPEPEEPAPVEPEVMMKDGEADFIDDNEDVIKTTKAENPPTVAEETSQDEEGIKNDYKIEENTDTTNDLKVNDGLKNFLKATRKSLAFISNPEEKRKVVDSVLKQVNSFKPSTKSSISNIVKAKSVAKDSKIDAIKTAQDFYNNTNPHIRGGNK